MMVRYLIVFLPFLISCGGGKNPSGFSDNHSYGETFEKICYNSSSCFSLKVINPDEFGYEKPTGNISPIQYRKPVRAIKLDEVDLSTKLSANFRASEFLSLVKGPIGIYSPIVVQHLQGIRDTIQQALRINSGYRPPFYNDDLPGAATWSRHMYGDAADIVSPGVGLADLANICKAHGAAFTQLYENHVHCDWRHETLYEEFYGPEPIIPKSEVEILADLSGKSDIVIDGKLKAGNRVTVTSILLEQEDPSEKLLRQWEIVYPSGQTREFTQAELTLDLEPGEYVIKHVLGGNIYLEKSFEVP